MPAATKVEVRSLQPTFFNIPELDKREIYTLSRCWRGDTVGVERAADLETERLEVLGQYGVLDTEPEPSFERVVRFAERFLEVPIVLVTLVAEKRGWFKARVGLELYETGWDISFCDHTICQDGVMVVRDAQKDPRFRDNPLITGIRAVVALARSFKLTVVAEGAETEAQRRALLALGCGGAGLSFRQTAACRRGNATFAGPW